MSLGMSLGMLQGRPQSGKCALRARGAERASSALLQPPGEEVPASTRLTGATTCLAESGRAVKIYLIVEPAPRPDVAPAAEAEGEGVPVPEPEPAPAPQPEVVIPLVPGPPSLPDTSERVQEVVRKTKVRDPAS